MHISRVIGFLILSVLQSSFIYAQEDKIKAYLDSAAIYQLSGDTMEVYYLTKALRLQPYNHILYELRAYAKSGILKNNDTKYGPKGAIKDFDIAIKLDSKNAVYYEQRGYQKFLIGKKYEALNDLNKAIRLDKTKASFYRKRGDILWEIKDFQRAIFDFYEASDKDTSSLYSIRKIGDCFYELGNMRDAIKYYNIVIAKAPTKPTFNTLYIEDYVLALLYRGNSHYSNLTLRKAIPDYTEVITYNEKFMGIIDYTLEAYQFRGLAKIRNDEKEEGCGDLKTADSLGNKEAKRYIDLYCK